MREVWNSENEIDNEDDINRDEMDNKCEDGVNEQNDMEIEEDDDSKKDIDDTHHETPNGEEMRENVAISDIDTEETEDEDIENDGDNRPLMKRKKRNKQRVKQEQNIRINAINCDKPGVIDLTGDD